MAQRKKALVKEGKLDKYGRKNDKTPSDYLSLVGSSAAATSSSVAGAAAVAAPVTAADPAPVSAVKPVVGEDDGSHAEKDKEKKKKKKSKVKEDGDESPTHKKSKL